MLTPEESPQQISEQPTRQQLDELDALMQRMLALPVSGSEVSTPVIAPAIPAAATLKELSSASPREDEVVTVPAVFEGLAFSSRGEDFPPRHQTAQTADPVFEDFRFDLLPAQAIPPTPDSRHEPVVYEGTSRVEEEMPRIQTPSTVTNTKIILTWWMRPLLWCNQLYDAVTMCLGPLGSRLRVDGVRAALGWIGILLLAGVLTWVTVDGIGWIW